VENEEVVIELRGIQTFLSLRKNVKIPLRCIADLSTAPATIPILALRFGTHIPGLFAAGSFWTKGGKTFYYLRRRNRERCITLMLREHKYARVIVEVEDKDEVARRIKEALSR